MSADLPPQAYASALASFPHMSIHRLGALLRHHPPDEAYAIAIGEHAPSGLIERVLVDDDVRAAWQRAGRSALLHEMWQRCLGLGLRVLLYDDADYPVLLRNDPLPPPVLFAEGDLTLLGGRRAAIVGTRNDGFRPPRSSGRLERSVTDSSRRS